MLAFRRPLAMSLVAWFGLVVGTGLHGACAQGSAKDLPTKARKAKHPAPGPALVPAAPTASSTALPMDFSGMSRSVNDLNTPSNARANTQFNPEGGRAGGFSPGATFKF